MVHKPLLKTLSLTISAIFALMLISPFTRAANAEEETEKRAFSFELPDHLEGFVYRLTDGDANSRISFEEEGLAVDVNGDIPALLVEWYQLPEKVSVLYSDKDGAVIGEEVCSDLYENLLRLPEGCTSVRIQSENPFSVSEITPFNGAEADSYIPLTLPEKADILCILAHTGDETLILPGLDAYYAGNRGAHVVHVYFSHKNRQQIRETLNVLRMYGNRIQPVFLGYRYYFLDMKFIRYMAKIWDKKTTQHDIVSAIRRFKPEVVVTHAAEGELEDGMRVFLSAMVCESAAHAADRRNDSKSEAEYGAWRVKKLYLNTVSGSEDAADGLTEIPANEPFVRDPQGKSCAQTAEEGVKAYKTLGVFHYDISDAFIGLKLAESTVGPDLEATDVFEHIDPAELTEPEEFLLPEEPALEEPAEETEPESEELAAEPDATPEPEVPAESTETAVLPEAEEEDPVLKILPFAAAAAALVFLIAALLFRKRSLPLSIISAVLVLLLASLSVFLFLRRNAEPAVEQAAAETAETVPEEEPDGMPAEPEQDELQDAEEEDATEEEADDAEEEWNRFFLEEGEEERIVADPDAGKWEYTSDILSILIDKYAETNADGEPVVYYIAHIRMRDIDSYRSGFGYFNEEGSAKAKPYEIARKYRAVLAITGDNLVNADTRNKGVLIRNGRLYWKGNRKTPTMAFHSDFTITIYDPETLPETILEDGVQDSYGFGPILVTDGAAMEELGRHRLNRSNPRCGLGMVEPGHYVAIVADGRQPNHSVGMTLVDFADLFVREGCTVAYNMDGGVSAGMVFMGEHINRHRSSHTGRVSAQRPWPDALMFGYSEQVPSVDDPIINTGNGNEADRNRKKLSEQENG